MTALQCHLLGVQQGLDVFFNDYTPDWHCQPYLLQAVTLRLPFC